MNCPVCKGVQLAPCQVEMDLSAFSCGQCRGYWINSGELWPWLERHASEQAPSIAQAATAGAPAKESKGVRLCPGCGHFISRYKVSPDLEFTLDRCGSCGGVWLDAAEWEFLRAHQLHYCLHQVFSPAWQFQVRQQEAERAREEQFERIVGAADYREAKRIKNWLAAHPRRTEILGYLGHQEKPDPA